MRSLPEASRFITSVRGLRRRVLSLDAGWACRDSLQRAPVPLYSESARLAVLFSPKAGCTLVVKWFFLQDGVLDEAMRYSHWPHDYREDILYARPGYSEGLASIPSLGSRVVKFVRNPYDRAVSSYLHFSRLSRVAQPVPAALEVLTSIADRLGRDRTDGFSFREFVSFLGGIDLDAADPHFRRQIGTCERSGRLPQMRVVKIEEGEAGIARLERELDLKSSDYGLLRDSRHHTTRTDVPGFFGDTRFASERRDGMPLTTAFYDHDLAQAVHRLYFEDCARYGYELPVN